MAEHVTETMTVMFAEAMEVERSKLFRIIEKLSGGSIYELRRYAEFLCHQDETEREDSKLTTEELTAKYGTEPNLATIAALLESELAFAEPVTENKN